MTEHETPYAPEPPFEYPAFPGDPERIATTNPNVLPLPVDKPLPITTVRTKVNEVLAA